MGLLFRIIFAFFFEQLIAVAYALNKVLPGQSLQQIQMLQIEIRRI